MPQPIRLALIGAGIFARDDHVPALRALADRFEIVAVYSRSRATADALLPHLPRKADVYTDLAVLLQRQDIDAVDIVLPIEPLPAAVDLALAAEKHVISEKPISPNVATGRRLVSVARNHPEQVWLVAESDRYEPAFARAAEIIQSGEIGKVITASWAKYVSMTPDNKYWHTAWRRDGSIPGGFLLDGGVHHAAIFRRLLGEIVSVRAEVRQMRDDLKPADTAIATFEFESGVIGSYTVTFAAGARYTSYINVAGDKGLLRADTDELIVQPAQGEARTEDFRGSNSIYNELKAFADAVQYGKTDPDSALEALRDVAVIEAILKSGASGERVQVETFPELEQRT